MKPVLRLAGLVLTVLLVVAACGDDEGSPAAERDDSSPTTAVHRGSSDSPVCALLGTDTVSEALEVAASSPSGDPADCTWELEGGDQLQLSLLRFSEPGEGGFAFDNIYGRPGQDPNDPDYGVLASVADYVEVDGLQGAFVSGHGRAKGGELAVLKGATIVRLTLSGFEDIEERLMPLAERVLDQLDEAGRPRGAGS